MLPLAFIGDLYYHPFEVNIRPKLQEARQKESTLELEQPEVDSFFKPLILVGQMV